MRPTYWFGTVLLLAVLAILFAEVISSDSPLYIIRYVFGFIFVAVLPGYCLVNMLFSRKHKLDLTEEAVLSVALSFSIAGLTGLFLGLSPIGISFTSIVVSLGTIALVLATIALIRKRKSLITTVSNSELESLEPRQ